MPVPIDTYSLRACIAPIFLTILPLLLAINLWAPKSVSLEVLSGSTIVSIALSVLAAQLGRHGKTKEPGLWQSWGGPPTTRFLRHRDTQFNPIRRARCHKNLEKCIPEIHMPTAQEEIENPLAADQVYEMFTRYLIDRTRDKKRYPLIFKENVNYGFLRNLWGLKGVGIFISGLSLIGSGFYGCLQWVNHKTVAPEALIMGGLCLLAVLLWIFWVKPDTIRIPAEAYAERLLEFCENMNS
jgi:hypothetical protein